MHRVETPDPSTALPSFLPTEVEHASDQTRTSVVTAVPASRRPAASNSVDVATWVLGVWGLGAAFALAFAAGQIRRFSRLVRTANQAPDELRRQVEMLSRRLGLRRAPRVCLIPGKLCPMLWAAAGRAVLLLPEDLVHRLDREQKVTLLAHELAHLRRRDHLVRYLELLVRALHWWNPSVWWACRELRRAEEECCDAWVLWALGIGRPYRAAIQNGTRWITELSRPPETSSPTKNPSVLLRPG